MFLLLCFIITTIKLCSSMLSNNLFNDTNDYAQLAIDIQDLYKTTNIYIVYDDTDENLHTSTRIINIVKKLSMNEIYSQGIGQSDLDVKYNKGVSQYSRQLFVYHLLSEISLEKFESFTQKHSLSFHVWLALFWIPNESLREFCYKPSVNRFNLDLDTRMLVQCYDNPILSEWYYLKKKNEVKITKFIEWKPDTGVIMKNNKNMYRRRYEFQDEEIRISSVKEYDFRPSLETKNEHVSIYETVITEIIQSINITSVFVSYEDTYGVMNSTTNEWTGILGKLLSGDIDVAVAGIISTSERHKYFDIVWPIMVLHNKMYIREPDNPVVQWSAYLKTFTHKLWMSILIIIVIASIVLNIIKFHKNEKNHRLNHLMENYLYVWGMFCQQGFSDITNSSAIRTVYVSLSCTAFVIMAFYSASLISNLTTFFPALPFKSFAEFFEDGSYKVIIIRNSTEHELLKPSIRSKLKKLLKSADELPDYFEDAYHQVCNEKTVLYSSINIHNNHFRGKVPCRITKLLIGSPIYLSVALTKHNPLTKLLNHYLRKFEEHGILERIKNMYVTTEINYPKKENSAVTFWEIFPLITILLVGFNLSILILIFEYIHYKLKHSRRNLKVWNSYYIFQTLVTKIL